MSKTAKTTAFLKECLSDSLLKLMGQKPFAKITVDEIALEAGVNRSTWFRNYSSKTDALAFKLEQQWRRWSGERELPEYGRFTLDNAADFFRFSYDNRQILTAIWDAGLYPPVYEAFYRIMKPHFGDGSYDGYQSRFFSYGLFGLLTEWIKRDFRESPEEMFRLFQHMIRKR